MRAGQQSQQAVDGTIGVLGRTLYHEFAAAPQHESGIADHKHKKAIAAG